VIAVFTRPTKCDRGMAEIDRGRRVVMKNKEE